MDIVDPSQPKDLSDKDEPNVEKSVTDKDAPKTAAPLRLTPKAERDEPSAVPRPVKPLTVSNRSERVQPTQDFSWTESGESEAPI